MPGGRTCVSCAKIVSGRESDVLTPASPSSGVSDSVQLPLTSSSRSHAPTPPEPHPPPKRSTRSPSSLIVVLGAEVGDELFAAHVAERVLELHELDEQVVLGVQPLG